MEGSAVCPGCYNNHESARLPVPTPNQLEERHYEELEPS